MLVQINTDKNVEGRDELARRIEAQVIRALERYADRVTRVEVHLGDEDSDKKAGGDDKRCLLEARLAGLRPIAVSHHAATTALAVDGALEKFGRAVESTLGRLRER